VGIILDSSATVAAERQGLSARQLLSYIQSRTGDDSIAISVISLLELAHGLARADTSERQAKRQQFLSELMSAVPLQEVTAGVALLAGRIDGHAQTKGVRIPLSDFLIGATAIAMGYAVATHNLRHFAMIPELIVRPL
jgi:tRNA(fMet)-specific endonuclease VapC